jgi:beta-galactosidase
MDYLGEAGIGQAMTDSTTMCWPWIISNCGDLDIMGYKKPQSYYRDVVWDRSKIEMAVEEIPPAGKQWMIRAWGWPREFRSWTWPGNEGKKMNVNVYSRGDEVRLYINDSLTGSQTSDKAVRFTYNFKVLYRPGILKAVTFTGGKEVASAVLKTAGPPAKLMITADRQEITTNRNDLCYLTVDVLDKNGIRIPNFSSPVTFTCEGEAELAAVDNANPREPRSFQSGRCNAYQGRCMAIIRPTGKPGMATMKVTADGLPQAEYTVGVK